MHRDLDDHSKVWLFKTKPEDREEEEQGCGAGITASSSTSSSTPGVHSTYSYYKTLLNKKKDEECLCGD